MGSENMEGAISSLKYFWNAHLKTQVMDFPGGSLVKNPPAKGGDMGLIPGPRRFHVPWGSQVHAPQLRSLAPWSPCSAGREVTAVRNPTSNKSDPLEKSLRTTTKTQRRKNGAHRAGCVWTTTECPEHAAHWLLIVTARPPSWLRQCKRLLRC